MRALEYRLLDGRPIALARILLALALPFVAIEATGVLSRIASGRLQYPVWDFIPAPTVFTVNIFFLSTLLASLSLLFGLYTAVAAGSAAAMLAGALLWDQQTYSSHHLLLTLLLGYLAFARSDARWSIKARKSPEIVPVPWWPQFLMLTQVSVLYCFAALSKINPLFLPGEKLASVMWVELPAVVYPVIAVGTVGTELFLAVALWIPRVRVVAVCVGVLLHLCIVILLTDLTEILFAFALATTSTYWLFLSRPSFF